MKITGIKKAVGEYKRANAGGSYSSIYGHLMLDRSNGEVWTDQFCSIGHNSWTQYHDDAIINLVSWARFEGYEPYEYPVNMANVKMWATQACSEYARKEAQ